MVIDRFIDIDLTKVKGILLDLDDTIYDYAPCHDAALLFCHEKLQHLIDISFNDFSALYAEARSSVHKQLKGFASSHSRLLYFQVLFENYYKQTKFDYSLSFEEYYWSSFINQMQIKEDSKKFLEKVKMQKIPVCIITDLTTQIQIRKVIKLDISNYLDYLVSSEEAGADKPSPRIFALGLEKLRLKADDVIMIGDSLEKDGQGAMDSGIKHYLI